jgi:AcrR family transcriptional regulator
MSDSSIGSLRVRADAQRNRERLLEVARDAMASDTGVVSLEAIAKDAGVGIGTLYRHFPTREALVEAVYRTELAAVFATAAELLAAHDPPTAMRLWMDQYAAFVRTKRGMAESLRSLMRSGTIASSETRKRVTQAIQTILDAGVDTNTLRADVRAEDVAASLVGIFLATPDVSQVAQTGRMLDILFAGLRTVPPAKL